MTDPLTLEMKMRQMLAGAMGTVSKGEPFIDDSADDTALCDFWYARGIQDTIELLLPDVISMRKVREWLKDWALSMPIDDLEAFTGTLK
jgi:hypothetical protein